MDDTHARDLACLVIGGGPAGLTAAIYLARFHLPVTVLDDGRSRAAMIPLTRNHAGYPEGIAGAELLRRMRRQAEGFGVTIRSGRANSLRKAGNGFRVETGDGAVRASKILLATGVENRRPGMTDALHEEALRRGLLRYCPVCDGFEVTDMNIALLGSGDHALREAQFLRSYSARVTLLAPDGPHRWTPGERAELARWAITPADGPVYGYSLEAKAISLLAGGRRLSFDTLYPALGTTVRSELARMAGAATSADGGIIVDRRQMTSVEGLYAAGDVVLGLDQIGNAMGQAGVAATAIRNAICEARPLRRAAHGVAPA
ncbi:NAD(P)/FAD-dependent oxidoreductase [Aestuariivirga sp.]|uniref:NAD(P)/FAD-dependent oxidoreductase n=1 Tax=Aestuariivirga sp. TaxID=2650926 RepID=UPI00391D7054